MNKTIDNIIKEWIAAGQVDDPSIPATSFSFDVENLKWILEIAYNAGKKAQHDYAVRMGGG